MFLDYQKIERVNEQSRAKKQKKSTPTAASPTTNGDLRTGLRALGFKTVDEQYSELRLHNISAPIQVKGVGTLLPIRKDGKTVELRIQIGKAEYLVDATGIPLGMSRNRAEKFRVAIVNAAGTRVHWTTKAS